MVCFFVRARGDQEELRSELRADLVKEQTASKVRKKSNQFEINPNKLI